MHRVPPFTCTLRSHRPAHPKHAQAQAAQFRRTCCPLHTHNPMPILVTHAPRGDFGRLGHGECGDVFVPRPIEFFEGRRVAAVACGDTHTLVVTEGDGALYTFGRNQNGQLGLGHTHDCLSPQPVLELQVG